MCSELSRCPLNTPSGAIRKSPSHHTTQAQPIRRQHWVRSLRTYVAQPRARSSCTLSTPSLAIETCLKNIRPRATTVLLMAGLRINGDAGDPSTDDAKPRSVGGHDDLPLPDPPVREIALRVQVRSQISRMVRR